MKYLFWGAAICLCWINSFGQNRTIDSLLALVKSNKEDTSKVNNLNLLAQQYIIMDTYSKGNTAVQEAMKLAGKLNFKKGIADSYNIIGVSYYKQGRLTDALKNRLTALKIRIELGDKIGTADLRFKIGREYQEQGNLPQALDYYLKSLKLREELGNKNKVAVTLNAIGQLYDDLAEHSKALDYYFKALNISEDIGDKKLQASSLGNIGVTYANQAEAISIPSQKKKLNNKALEFYQKALKISEELEDKSETARNFGNIGCVYEEQARQIISSPSLSSIEQKMKNELRTKALINFAEALKVDEEIGNKADIASWLNDIGSIYTQTGQFKEAEFHLKKAIALDESRGALDGLRQDEEFLSQLYDTTKQYKLALIHFKKSTALKDTIFSQENKKQFIRKEMNYEFDKKEAATKAEHDKEIAVAVAEKKKQQIIIWSVIAGLLLVIVFASFVFRSLRITRKQKNIIELQKNEVDKQKEIVEKQKEKIVDSITYAQRIQQSILMEESEVQNYLPNSFIYFQPKDIVSGDFYWCSKTDDKIIIAAVDCTGHGVPGAFMSMIGNTLLNQIVNEKHITKPSEILHYLNLGVYEALHQKKDGALSDDGMDIALCTIDYENNEIQYAGQNPLYILLDGKIEVIKGDIYGIGGGGMIAKIHDPLKKVFANHVIPINEGMSIYLSTDGYMDQFGGSDRKKFGTQRFKDLLLNNLHLNMQKQKEFIASAQAEWKGKTVQIDDVLVIGIRV